MTVPTISNLPTVPATSDPNFETEAPALFNHIKNTFVSEMNSAISFINSSTFDATVEFKNANFTAARNFLYMIDTSSAAISVTLPANPSTGDQLLLMDQKRTFGTNNLTIGRNSQNINGSASDVVSKSTGALIRCIFQASYGWTVDLYEGEWESGTNAGDLVYNGGNVGIGTSSPDASLHIKNNSNIPIVIDRNQSGDRYAIELRQEDTTDGNSMRIAYQTDTTGTGASTNVNFAAIEFSADTHDQPTREGSINFRTSQGGVGDLRERMIIKSDGKVGIGTSAPSAKLHIQSGQAYLNYGGSSFYSNTDDEFSKDHTQNNHLQLNTAGFRNLCGITGVTGTAAATRSTTGFLLNSRYGASNFAASSMNINCNTGSGTIEFFTGTSSTAPTRRMIIDSSGNVGIGTSAPGGKLEIAGDKDATNLIVGAPLHTVNGGGLANSSQLLFDNNYTTGTSGTAYIRHYANSHQNSEGALFFGTTSSTGTTSTALVIRGDGNVGIGLGSPARKLTLYQSDSDGSFLQFANQTTGALITDGSHVGINNSEDLEIAQLETGKQIQFWNGGTRRLVIDSAGDVEVKTGNLVIGTAGKGIDFSATSGTGTSELLTDYEEGTFTPYLLGATTAGSFTYSLQLGRYTKIGNLVQFQITLATSATATAAVGDITIRGLPFTSNSTASVFGSASIGWTQNITGGADLGAYVINNNTYIALRDINNGSGNMLQGSAVGSTFYFLITGTYQT